MMDDGSDRIIIVEVLTDKRQIEKVITDEITIVCTKGTLGVEKFDEMLEGYDLDHKDVYILDEENDAGMKHRKQLAHVLPHAEHIYVSCEFREVVTTPEDVLATALVDKDIIVNPIFIT